MNEKKKKKINWKLITWNLITWRSADIPIIQLFTDVTDLQSQERQPILILLPIIFAALLACVLILSIIAYDKWRHVLKEDPALVKRWLVYASVVIVVIILIVSFRELSHWRMSIMTKQLLSAFVIMVISLTFCFWLSITLAQCVYLIIAEKNFLTTRVYLHITWFCLLVIIILIFLFIG